MGVADEFDVFRRFATKESLTAASRVSVSKESSAHARRARSAFASKESMQSRQSKASHGSAQTSDTNDTSKGSGSGSEKERPTYGSRRKKKPRATSGGVSNKSSVSGGHRNNSRMGTNLSSVSGRSGFMDDSDSDGLEDNLDTMPENLRPLQLRGEVILKKDARAKNREILEEAKRLRLEALFPPPPTPPSPPTPPPPTPPPEPPEELSCGKRWAGVQVCCSLFWALLLSISLGVMVLQSLNNVGDGKHRLVAETALRRLEANASGLLAPALAVVRAVALGARSSLLVNTDLDPLSTLLAVAGSELALSPNVLQTQVIGLLPNKMARMVPGLLHDPGASPNQRRPLLVDVPLSRCATSLDPLACFELNTTGLTLHDAPSEAAALAWLGPIYMQKGNRLQRVEPDEWPLTLHLLAAVNLTSTFGPASPPPLALDVAVDLTRVVEAARVAVPPGGSLHISTPDGWLVACSTWEEHRPALPVNPLVVPVLPVYHRIWDTNRSYAKAITPEILAKRARSEIWVDKDLVIVRPLAFLPHHPGAATASASSLRGIVFVPRDEAVRPLIGYLVYALLSTLATGVLLLLGLAIARTWCSVAKVRRASTHVYAWDDR